MAPDTVQLARDYGLYADDFDRLANDAALQWRHRLAPGEALLFDNWRVLHGRAAYEGKRRLCGAYLNHEDFESRLRLAGPTVASTRA